MGIGMRECPMCLTPFERHANARYCSSVCKTRAAKVAKYGLSATEYRLLIESTGGRCPICKKKVKRWNVDHDHETMRTTGVTCALCNGYLLAFTYHDPEIARRLLDYLENPPVDKLFGERITRDYKNTDISRLWRK